MNTDKLLEINNLSFAYDDNQVLQGLNMTAKRGEFIAIVGENGSGKSTLLNLILSKFSSYEGEIKLFGKSIKEDNSYKRLAYISQNTVAKYKDFPTTVSEVIGLYLRELKSSWSLETCLKRMKLQKHRHNNLSELSGGQLQRVALLLALMKQADLIILDEATSGVDQNFSRELYEELRAISREAKTVLMVTHQLQEASKWIDRVIRLENKQARSFERLEEVFPSLERAYTEEEKLWK